MNPRWIAFFKLVVLFLAPLAASYAAEAPKPRNAPKLIIINGVSKAYAMTGFRIGWAVANKKLIFLVMM